MKKRTIALFTNKRAVIVMQRSTHKPWGIIMFFRFHGLFDFFKAAALSGAAAKVIKNYT